MATFVVLHCYSHLAGFEYLHQRREMLWREISSHLDSTFLKPTPNKSFALCCEQSGWRKAPGHSQALLLKNRVALLGEPAKGRHELDAFVADVLALFVLDEVEIGVVLIENEKILEESYLRFLPRHDRTFPPVPLAIARIALATTI
jgi:hypothetical protein